MELATADIVLPKIDQFSCRACLKSGGIGIMHEFTDTADCSDGEKELRALYKKLTKIEVHLSDKKRPILICGSCTNKLINAYEFILDAQRAESLLSIHFKESQNEQNIEQDSNDVDVELINEEAPIIEQYKVEYITAESVTANADEDFQNLDAVVNEVELNCEMLVDVEDEAKFSNQNDEALDGKTFSDIELLDDADLIDEDISSDVADHIITKKTGAIGTRLSSGPKHQINCDECQRGFAKLETYQRHKEIAHTFAPREEIVAKQTNEQNILCPFCPRTFVHKNDLVRHVNAIHPEDAARNPIDVEPKKQKRQYKKATCPHCQKEFPQASIKIHIRRHLGINPYKCDTCDKAFPRKQDLTVHIRQHTGERPHVCSVCAKSFIRPNKLSRHMRIHLGIRPYNCDVCLKSFSQETTPSSSKRAERNRRYFAKIKNTEKHEEIKQKRAAAMREYRARQKAAEKTLPAPVLNEVLEKRRRANRERARRYRQKQAENASNETYFKASLKNLRGAMKKRLQQAPKMLIKQEIFDSNDTSMNTQSFNYNTTTTVYVKEEHLD